MIKILHKSLPDCIDEGDITWSKEPEWKDSFDGFVLIGVCTECSRLIYEVYTLSHYEDKEGNTCN